MSTIDETVCQYCGKSYGEHGDEWWQAGDDHECKGLKSYYIGTTRKAIVKPPQRIVEDQIARLAKELPAETFESPEKLMEYLDKKEPAKPMSKPKERFKRVRG